MSSLGKLVRTLAYLRTSPHSGIAPIKTLNFHPMISFVLALSVEDGAKKNVQVGGINLAMCRKIGIPRDLQFVGSLKSLWKLVTIVFRVPQDPCQSHTLHIMKQCTMHGAQSDVLELTSLSVYALCLDPGPANPPPHPPSNSKCLQDCCLAQRLSRRVLRPSVL